MIKINAQKFAVISLIALITGVGACRWPWEKKEEAPATSSGGGADSSSSSSAASLLAASGPSSVVASACSTVFTITSKNSAGTATSVTTNTVVTLSDASAGGSFYSNSSCGAQISQVTISSGASSATFYYKKSSAASVTLTVSATGLTSGTASLTVSASSDSSGASKLTLTGPSSVTAGACSTAFIFSTKNSAGTAVVRTVDTVVSYSDGGAGGTFYSSANCSSASALTGVTLSSGISTGDDFFYKKATAGSVTLTVSASGLASASASITVASGGGSSNTATVTLNGTAKTFSTNCDCIIHLVNDPNSMLQFQCFASDGTGIYLTAERPVTAGKTYHSGVCEYPTGCGHITYYPNPSNLNAYYASNSTSGGTIILTSMSGATIGSTLNGTFNGTLIDGGIFNYGLNYSATNGSFSCTITGVDSPLTH